MSTLYITEFSDMPIVAEGVPDIPMTPPVAEQVVTISGSSAASSAFNAKTRFVLISSDVVCSIAWSATPGATPTATATNMRMPASTPLKFGVNAGDKVAVITNS